MGTTQSDGGLNVIALVSGGKDSFFSLLHCRANGHRVVALANLHPAAPLASGASAETSTSTPAATISAAPAASAADTPALEPSAQTLSGGPNKGPGQGSGGSLPDRDGGAPGNEVLPKTDEDEQDLNSFMYQTVGHQVIPLYAEATGIPIYRRAITGRAVQVGKYYSPYRPSSVFDGSEPAPHPDGHRTGKASGSKDHSPKKPEDQTTSAASASAEQDAPKDNDGAATGDADETESMVPLLRSIMEAHPEANAICAGAILSTYQRTRVESVAARLGLTPLAYLWKFPVLPAPTPSDPALGTDAQLLDDMAAAGMEARIIKVASGGLDDTFLWTNVADAGTKVKLANRMRRYGVDSTGAVIGEGGEFETLVLDGPSSLFKKRIVVAEEDRRVVPDGGGSAWLSLRNARLEDKGDKEESECGVRIPDLLDARFARVRDGLDSTRTFPSLLDLLSSLDQNHPKLGCLAIPLPLKPRFYEQENVQRGMFTQPTSPLQQWNFAGGSSPSIEAETRSVVERIHQRLLENHLTPSAILSATILLRRMADFPAVNKIYGTLFDAPNPATRVTVSCGDGIFKFLKADITVYITVHTALPPDQRTGLHVQSRSYWAPANIGPYSQAISFPVGSLKAIRESGCTFTSHSRYGPRLALVAGQIPLVPATMDFPADDSSSSNSEGKFPLKLVLSLQHLWRIGADMGVQWWTSAVAFIPKSSPEEALRKTKLAGQTWRDAHLFNFASKSADDDEDEEEDGNKPDLWDRRFNPMYRSFAGGSQQNKKSDQELPDWSILHRSRATESDQLGWAEGAIPPMFVAEVEELPRGADVEWHAHTGIVGTTKGSVRTRRVRLPRLPPRSAVDGLEEDEEWRREQLQSQKLTEWGAVWQVIARDDRGVTSYLETVVAERISSGDRPDYAEGAAYLHMDAARPYMRELAGSMLGNLFPMAEMAAVVYVDVERLKPHRYAIECPVVPCRSLRDAAGERLAAVTVYRSALEEVERVHEEVVRGCEW